MQLTPKSELDDRIQRFQSRLSQEGLDGALILQNVDRYYFSGTVQESVLFVPTWGSPLLLPKKSVTRARTESPLDEIIPLISDKALPDLVASHSVSARVHQRLGMELDVLPVNRFRHFQAMFENVEFVDCSMMIREIRAKKSAYEIDLLRRAARVSEALYQAVPHLLHEGISELALAGQLEAISRRYGHQGIVRMRRWNDEIFYGHLMSGESAAIPSYLASPTGGPGANPSIAQGPGARLIRRREPILVDYLFAPDGYIVDQTRIFAIDGLDDDLLYAHRAMQAVQAAVVEAARPGVTGEQLWTIALDIASEWDIRDHFMGFGQDRVRFVGHGVGLELDELPILAPRQLLPLEPGMVFALEPKAIFPGRGVVGVENTFLVTTGGVEQLTKLPDHIVFARSPE